MGALLPPATASWRPGTPIRIAVTDPSEGRARRTGLSLYRQLRKLSIVNVPAAYRLAVPVGRDDFNEATRTTLARRAAHRCSKPDCRAPTSGPATDVQGTVNVGVSAHITAAARGGPRYDESLTADERRNVSNGVWLCQTCGKLVDSDNARFSVDELRAWKVAAEVAAERELGVASGPRGRVAVLERTLTGHTNYVWDVIVTPDGRRAVSASNDRTAALWDLNNGQRLCLYRGAEAEVCSIALSPDGRHVAGGCLNGEVRVWRVDVPDPLYMLNHGAPDAKVGWSDNRLLTAGSDGKIRSWSPNIEITNECAAHDAAILRVLALNDGRVATASEDGTVRVWSAGLSGPTAELQGHTGHVNSVAIAEKAELAITGSQDCTVKVWALGSCGLRRTLHGHCDQVWRVAVDPSERWIASGSGDNTVWMWDLFTGLPVDELPHDDCVAAVAFSPDGTRLVVGCDNAKLYVYGVQ